MLEIAILKVDRIGSDPDTCEFCLSASKQALSQE